MSSVRELSNLNSSSPLAVGSFEADFHATSPEHVGGVDSDAVARAHRAHRAQPVSPMTSPMTSASPESPPAPLGTPDAPHRSCMSPAQRRRAQTSVLVRGGRVQPRPAYLDPSPTLPRKHSASEIPTPARSLLKLSEASSMTAPASPSSGCPTSPAVKAPIAKALLSPAAKSPSTPLRQHNSSAVQSADMRTHPASLAHPSPNAHEMAAALLLLSRRDTYAEEDKENAVPTFSESLVRARPTTAPTLLREVMAYIEKWRASGPLRLTDDDAGGLYDAAIDYSEPLLTAFKKYHDEGDETLQTELLKFLHGPDWRPQAPSPPSSPSSRPLRQIQAPTQRARSTRRVGCPPPMLMATKPQALPPAPAPASALARTKTAIPSSAVVQHRSNSRLLGPGGPVTTPLSDDVELAKHRPTASLLDDFPHNFGLLKSFMHSAHRMPRLAGPDLLPHEAALASWTQDILNAQSWGFLPSFAYAQFAALSGWRWAAKSPRLREVLETRRAASSDLVGRRAYSTCLKAVASPAPGKRVRHGSEEPNSPFWIRQEGISWSWKRLRPSLWVLT